MSDKIDVKGGVEIAFDGAHYDLTMEQANDLFDKLAVVLNRRPSLPLLHGPLIAEEYHPFGGPCISWTSTGVKQRNPCGG